MLQSTPAQAFGRSRTALPVLQTQTYSCVPAACATALHELGVPASEQDLAGLTRTRPGRGATLFRAADGLDQCLAGRPWQTRILETPFDALRDLPAPILAPLRFDSDNMHMVVIEGFGSGGVRIADPLAGWTVMPLDQFAAVYAGRVIVFETR
jgi:hypothetical protein